GQKEPRFQARRRHPPAVYGEGNHFGGYERRRALETKVNRGDAEARRKTNEAGACPVLPAPSGRALPPRHLRWPPAFPVAGGSSAGRCCPWQRSEEHTSELQSQSNLVCRLLLEKKKKKK